MSITEKDLEQAYLDGWNDHNEYLVGTLNKACDSYETLLKTEQDERMKTMMKAKYFELTNLMGYFATKRLKK